MINDKYVFRLLLILIIIVFGCQFISSPPLRAEAPVWSNTPIPEDGPGGHWMLAEGSDIDCLRLTSEGVLVCTANPQSTPHRLFKSTDRGNHWSIAGSETENITAIAVLDDDPDCLYYATVDKIYRSTDAGESFQIIASLPSDNVCSRCQITSLAVCRQGSQVYLAAGLRDPALSLFGGVYLFTENSPVGWKDTRIGQYDVCQVAFSPDSGSDISLTAVATDERDTFVINGTASGDWSSEAGPARLTGVTAINAAIGYPADFIPDAGSGAFIQYIAINSGQGAGGIFCLRGKKFPQNSELIDLKANQGVSTDFSCLAVRGQDDQTRLLAGAAGSALTVFSQDAGLTWQNSLKLTTGEFVSGIVLDAEGSAWAATGGQQSAVSVSLDSGLTWNQCGLIDARIETILDIAVSPDFDIAPAIFLLTTDRQISLWYSPDGAESWQRIFCQPISLSESFNLILLSPDYTVNGRVYLSGTQNRRPVIWYSADRGRTFTRHFSIDPAAGCELPVSCWAIAPGDVLFVGSSQDNQSWVYQTAPGSLQYIDRAAAGSFALNSLAVSPDFSGDSTLLAGNRNGGVLLSKDGGKVFTPLPFTGLQSPPEGSLDVAFDQDYARNHTIYSSSQSDGGGIYRLVNSANSVWRELEPVFPREFGIDALAVSSRGILYALNNGPSATASPGLERWPEAAQDSTGEFIFTATGSHHYLKKLRTSGEWIWTIDYTRNQLLCCRDRMAASVNLVSPAPGSTGQQNTGLPLVWDSMGGSAVYKWQVSCDPYFNALVDSGNAAACQVTLRGLEYNTTYYWRVKALDEEHCSRWSDPAQFITEPDPEAVLKAPVISKPKTGSISPQRPLFEWSVSSGAESYDLLVSQFDNFSFPAIDKSGSQGCFTNLWACDTDLKYDTGYYWKVRAVNVSGSSPWSGTGYFTVESAPGTVLDIPKPGSPVSTTAAALQPFFKWSVVEGAQYYRLVVSRMDNFSILEIDNICYANAWQCSRVLDYQTAYYWKVKAVNGDFQSDWSSVSVFTTRSLSGGSGSGGSGNSTTRTTSVTKSPAATPSSPASAILPVSTPEESSPAGGQTFKITSTSASAISTAPSSSPRPTENSPDLTEKADTKTAARPTAGDLTKNSQQPGKNSAATSALSSGSVRPDVASIFSRPALWISGGVLAGLILVSVIVVILRKKA